MKQIRILILQGFVWLTGQPAKPKVRGSNPTNALSLFLAYFFGFVKVNEKEGQKCNVFIKK